ncbi:MAG: hypothetical protein ATN36_08390 [Epulopiscium sp. Nele67-Bin005]|nr:MAG: hypothetical protein ATN36_08390 [Epulopiscium sp. Nele67-Bin005]
MEKEVLTIKEASLHLGMEPYILRHYERELGLNILRNEQGYRMYTMENLEMLKFIQELRDGGLELKAIKNTIKDIVKSKPEKEIPIVENFSTADGTTNIIPLTNYSNSTQLQEGEPLIEVIQNIIAQTVRDEFANIQEKISVEVTEIVAKEVLHELTPQLEGMVMEQVTDIRQDVIEQNKKNEEYFEKLDYTMMEIQRTQQEALAYQQKVAEESKASILQRILKGKKSNN